MTAIRSRRLYAYAVLRDMRWDTSSGNASQARYYKMCEAAGDVRRTYENEDIHIILQFDQFDLKKRAAELFLRVVYE